MTGPRSPGDPAGVPGSIPGSDPRPASGGNERPAVSGEVVDAQPPYSGGPRPTGNRGAPSGAAWSAGSWSWSAGRGRRDASSFGLLLLALGGVLLADQVLPNGGVIVPALTTALGLWLLGAWVIRRRRGLYLGLLITALGLPALLVELGLLPRSDGYGAFLLGICLLVIGAARLAGGRSWGWQLVIGAVLAISGGDELTRNAWPGLPNLGSLAGPIALVVLGLLVLARSVRSTRR